MAKQAQETVSEFKNKTVSVNRVSKTVKGGKRFGLAALVVVGDEKGSVGYGTGKSKEAPDAMKKAIKAAEGKMIKVPLREGRTLHHDVKGSFGAGKVILRTAPAGTGIIAGGPMRAVFEMMGIEDVVAKSTGTSNPHNVIKATFNALLKVSSPRQIAAKRHKKVGDLVARRDGGGGSAAAAESKEVATND
ncbi:MAG: 30S ribosomal protein S5 [Alphaproteobacteria bacterium]|nr:30S ribosomal protein S5 [Alphaproteobacteria bacterium]